MRTLTVTMLMLLSCSQLFLNEAAAQPAGSRAYLIWSDTTVYIATKRYVDSLVAAGVVVGTPMTGDVILDSLNAAARTSTSVWTFEDQAVFENGIVSDSSIILGDADTFGELRISSYPASDNWAVLRARPGYDGRIFYLPNVTGPDTLAVLSAVRTLIAAVGGGTNMTGNQIIDSLNTATKDLLFGEPVRVVDDTLWGYHRLMAGQTGSVRGEVWLAPGTGYAYWVKLMSGSQTLPNPEFYLPSATQAAETLAVNQFVRLNVSADSVLARLNALTKITLTAPLEVDSLRFNSAKLAATDTYPKDVGKYISAYGTSQFVPLGRTYFFTNDTSDITYGGANPYRYARYSSSYVGMMTSILKMTAGSGAEIVDEWVSDSLHPYAQFIGKGVFRASFRASKDVGGDASATMSVSLFKRTVGGVETLLGQTSPTPALGLTGTDYDCAGVISTPSLLNTDDRLVFKVYVTSSIATGVYFTVEGASLSRVELSLSTYGGSDSSSGGATTLDALSDVDVASASLGDVLTKTGGTWQGAGGVVVNVSPTYHVRINDDADSLLSAWSKDSVSTTVQDSAMIFKNSVKITNLSGTVRATAGVLSATASDTVGLGTSLSGKIPKTQVFTKEFTVLDTVKTGGETVWAWKVPSAITITEISGFTDANTVTFNIEQRAETTPNTAGTDCMTADLVADTDQQEQTSFSDATVPANNWLVCVVSAAGDVTIFSVTIRYTID